MIDTNSFPTGQSVPSSKATRYNLHKVQASDAERCTDVTTKNFHIATGKAYDTAPINPNNKKGLTT